MRVLITNAELVAYAGTETYVYTLACALQQRGHEVVCYSPRVGEIAERLLKRGIRVVTNLEQMDERFDIIHGHHYGTTLEASFHYPDTPIYQVIHGNSSWQEQPLPRLLVDGYIAISEEIKYHLMSNLGIPSSEISIIRNPVDISRFSTDRAIHLPVRKLLFMSNRATSDILSTVRATCEIGNIELIEVGTISTPIWDVEKLIADVDAVISLGRGVLEALAMGRPAIIYDYNGGDGLVTTRNFDVLRERNFSGRVSRKYFTPEDLLREIRKIEIPDVLQLQKRVVEEHSSSSIAEAVESYWEVLLKRQPRKLRTIQNSAYLECFRRLAEFLMTDYDKAQLNLSYQKEVIEVLKSDIQRKDIELQQSLSDIHYLDGLLRERTEAIATLEHRCEELSEELKAAFETIEQKENNTKYALELAALKDRELSAIYSSKAWKAISIYRKWKNRVLKAVKNPKIVLRKFIQLIVNKPTYLSPVSGEFNHATHDPVVSVVIPIYDREDELRQSIESILNQTFQNFELILVCDGSPETTLRVVDEYKDHPKVRIFKYYNNSGNAVRGRNKAIKEARGRYLAFQDSDDIAEKNRLELSVAYLEKFNVDVVYGGWRALMDGTRVVEGLEHGQEVMSPDCDLDMLLQTCVPCQSTVMCRLDALRAVGGLKSIMRYREDHELWLRLAYHGYTFKAIPHVLTNLRLHSSNLELSFKDSDEYWKNLMYQQYKIVTPMKPKIGYVIPGCGISGGIAVVCQHVNRLLDRGYDVVLISEDENRTIDWFPNQRVNILGLHEAGDNFDILVATGWSTAYTVKEMKATRKFYFVQSDESRFYLEGSREWAAALETYKFDFEYMTEALWIKRWLKERFGHEASYVPNGIDDTIIYETEPLEPKGNKLRVLLEGPIDIPFKGMSDAFKAVEGLDCEVWCVSSAGRPKPGWRCDRFFEKVPMHKMKEIYSSCDVLLKMSRVEGFFGPPMEMMACGGTAVVGAVSGYDEYIVDGYNALVVPLGDWKAAHDALQRLIDDRSLLDTLKRHGRETAEKWRWEPTIDILERLFYPPAGYEDQGGQQ